MKTHISIVAAAAILSALLLLAGCGQSKYTPKADEELYGTWTNSSLSGEVHLPAPYMPQKVVITSSGFSVFKYADDFARFEVGSEQIDRRWTDSDGNIWYQAHSAHADGSVALTFQTLYKLNKAGTVQESVYLVAARYDPSHYPAKLDPNDSTYRRYDRAQK